MQDDGIRYIEQCLRVRLPEFYKAFLLTPPGELIEGGRRLSRERGEKRLLFALATDSQDIVQVNQDFRGALDSAGEADAKGLAVKYFAIGQEEGYPNYYVIDVGGRAKGVFHYDHEQGYCEPCYASLEKFVAELMESVDPQPKSDEAEPKKKGKRSHFGDDPEEMGYDSLDWKKE